MPVGIHEQLVEKEPRIILLTGDHLRHRFAARKLADKMNLVGIVSESKSPLPTSSGQLPADEHDIMTKHFAERDAVERRFFGASGAFPDTRLFETGHNTINTPSVFEWIQEQAPDVVLLYGSSIVKPPLLETYESKIINLHLGLSPYYRGSGTNFWPLVNREPECVGATIHLTVLRVDAGALLGQIRPVPEINDRAHELGTKTIMAGFDIMPLVVSRYLDGRIKPLPQDLANGRVYRRKDFSAAATLNMWKNFETGMMTEYLADLQARRQRFPIVEVSRDA